ncbi:ABC transporter ATP-binding protein [Sphingobacterium corticibacter]|uniref:ABC transporter ATP-binding protein n=1 Tax=Sphingobacterium corticibacter TaxID=2171749 RepID=A0A2T8HKD6_9SPHI|nr:ABC transporter ATP-binding protein [Sphingobacterium corticibacter]PVH25914.1 ABC transporter ATP-binding protein [Sphingobacterium corticibacter]
MSTTSSSCQYVPQDTQKHDLPLIYVHDVSCVFEGKDDVVAVDRVSVGIQENSITAIIGASGSGKSTLLKLIYGLLEPTNGEIRYRGWLVPTRKDKLIPGHEAMKMVSQNFDDLNLYAKVWDNVASQLSNINLEYKQRKTEETLQKLQISHLAQKRVADLSGGERQRVAICRALINDPEVLLMDEPFNQVDAAFRDALQHDIKQIVADTGLTVLLVSHDPAEVLAMSDQLIVMKDGKIIDSGNPKDLYFKPSNIYTAQLLAKSNILSASQARALDIETDSTIAIHQEDISLVADESARCQIQEIKFRGMYYEYVAGNGDVSVRAAKIGTPTLAKGDKVQVSFERFIEFGG